MEIKAPSAASYVVKKTPHFTPEQREIILKKTDYNVFNFPSNMVNVDFLTDSGTAALFQPMWAALALGDESYARNNWYYTFLDAVRDFCQRGNKPNKRYLSAFEGINTFEETQRRLDADESERGFVNGGIAQLEHPNVFLLPQGRCCENVLFQSLKTFWDHEKEPLVISNGLFDTTHANSKVKGFESVDLFVPDIFSGYPLEKVGKENPFKGNINLGELKKILEKDAKRTALVVMTLTNNTGAGQPVSMENLKEVRKLCTQHGIPLWFDAARIVDNAAFIKKYEEGHKMQSIQEILKQLFEMADGFHFSLKKALCNMGGFMCLRHEGPLVTKYPDIGHVMKKNQIIQYGNDSYGALSGRDLAAATVALYEVVKEDYIYARIEQTEYLAVGLASQGLPVILPPGGHAVYIDVNKMFEASPWNDFMGVGLVVELLRLYGIRACELGYMAWELDVYVEKHGKMPERLPPNLVRLAIPSNAYSKEHMDYVVKALSELNRNKGSIPGVIITRGKHIDLRHFVVGLKPKKLTA